MRLIDRSDYRVVSEYLEKQLWIAKEHNDLPATLEIERVLSAFDHMVDLMSEEEKND